MSKQLRAPFVHWQLPRSGWQRTGIFNTILEGVVCVVLASAVIRTATAAGAIEKNHPIFTGDCIKSGRLNLALHLLINIGSTCIVASSNYFMQILSSPTRQEVDKAHQNLRFLEIGVPSFRNIGNISTRKSVLWAFFMLSSVPIHILFNSAVFETDYQGSGFFMAIATEDFVEGGHFHGPGASLINPGTAMRDQNVNDSRQYDIGTWGMRANLTDFLDPTSRSVQNISSLAQSAKGWKRMDAYDCRKVYGTCTPRREWGNVVLVADGQFEGAGDPSGFIPDQLFNWTEAAVPWASNNNYTNDKLRAYWDRFGPLNESNSLWFSSWCRVRQKSPSHWGGKGNCVHSCGIPLGLGSTDIFETPDLEDALESTTSSWDIPLVNYRAGPGVVGGDFYDPPIDPFASSEVPSPASDMDPFLTYIDERPLFNTTVIDADTSLEVTHCYVQPLDDVCSVAVSNMILLVVTFCVMLKVLLSIMSLNMISGQPLATPGDALVSFIRQPDPTTKGMAAINLRPGTKKAPWGTDDIPQAVEWPDQKQPRIAAAIPLGSWLRTYGLIAPLLIGLGFLCWMAASATPFREDTGAFVHNQNRAIIESNWLNTLPFISQVILVNVPQLLLSYCYFAYNALITRACTESEWNSYAASYKPLRVSHPEKGQVQTYRLQLPYRISVPLIAVSALLHWIVSNAIYVAVSQGDYNSLSLADSIDTIQLSGITDNAYVFLGYSSVAAVIFVVLFGAMALAPIIFHMRLKRNMVICGNSSFSLSAACYVSTSGIYGSQSRSDESLGIQYDEAGRAKPRQTEESPFLKSGETVEISEEDTERAQSLHKISTSKVRWGVVRMPTEWYKPFHESGQHVEDHLAFGTEEQQVQTPQPGTFYV